MSKTGQSDFLKFNRIHVTADDDEIDEELLQHLREEAFDVTYLPFNAAGKACINELKHLANDLELGESYAIIAFNQAAYTCLDFLLKPQPKLAAIICYYPTTLPSPKATYPTNLQVLIHLSGSQPCGPDSSASNVRCYSYAKALVGFAEHDLETFDKVSFGLAWTRTLETL